MSKFKELKVWQISKELCVEIYKITSEGKFKKDFALQNQMRRCAISIPSNIAEGDERDTDKDSIRFFYFAKGSLAELRTQLDIAYEIGYIDKEKYNKLEQICYELGRMIGKLINIRKNSL